MSDPSTEDTMRTPTLKMDGTAREFGRYLYRVYVDERFIGSVARWDGERKWTQNAPWLPSMGRDESPAEAGRVRATRSEAVADLVECARRFGPLAGTP